MARQGLKRDRTGNAQNRLYAGIFAAATLALAGCSGGGGDNGHAQQNADLANPQGLVFTYPIDGQQDVTLETQMVADFADAVSGDVTHSLRLSTENPKGLQGPSVTVVKDDDQPNILRIVPSVALLPNTTYTVVATKTVGDGSTAFTKGQTLFRFTTAPRQGTPADGAFQVTEVTPGETNPITGTKSVFTQFNDIRAVFNEPVDISTVSLGSSFTVKNASGDEVPGVLSVLGRHLTFRPSKDFAAGNYRIAFSNDIHSAFGKSLKAARISRTVLSAGNMVEQNTYIRPTGSFDELPANDLNGQKINNVNIVSQLIGSNNQVAMNAPDRGGILTTLAQPGMPGFGDVFPNAIRAGQKFLLAGLKLRLGKQGTDDNSGIATPIDPSGPIQNVFINDASVNLSSNSLRNVATPTAVRLRFDLGIGTLVDTLASSSDQALQALANSVFNTSVLNIQAAGLATPQPNGDLVISTLGTFPINVNRTDSATIDFELTLVLPAGTQSDPVQPDTTGPVLTARLPSACQYVFGTPAYATAYQQQGVSPIAFPEQNCIGVLQGGGVEAPFINSFPIESSPAITFTEPLSPASVNATTVQLTSNGAEVPATYHVDGSSIVIDPVSLLSPNTAYEITVSNGVTDIAGNALQGSIDGGPATTMDFTTEPMLNSDNSTVIQTAPILSALVPGMPCAVEGGDFESGGDTLGQCVGDQDNNTSAPMAVLTHPVNEPITAYFTKLVQKDSIVLSDRCLTSGNGSSNDDSDDNDSMNANGSTADDGDATVAIQRMDSSGNCVGVVDGAIATGNDSSSDTLTRSFTFRPVNDFQADTRYWIVICGTQGSVCSHQIVDADGRALNTDPLAGTGSLTTSTVADDTTAGGPDLVTAFDTEPATQDSYVFQRVLPETDTNGNGRYDDINNNGQYDEGDERPQPANLTLIGLQLVFLGSGDIIPLNNGNRTDGRYPDYLSTTQPARIRESTESCQALAAITGEDGQPTVSNPLPDTCIPVTLLPGTYQFLTSLAPLGDGAATGRIMLRFYNSIGEDGDPVGLQSGYIVEKCTGTINGQAYDYEPCFTAHLRLIANAPDHAPGLTFDQQDVTINLVGPLTFEQNGRLTIALKNASQFMLQTSVNGILGVPATIAPGALTLQLNGNPINGGREFPDR